MNKELKIAGACFMGAMLFILVAPLIPDESSGYLVKRFADIVSLFGVLLFLVAILFSLFGFSIRSQMKAKPIEKEWRLKYGKVMIETEYPDGTRTYHEKNPVANAGR
ncbi:MAG: hypothetical protein Q7R59_01460 [bacterium]|nr:hypothetical protein [bacterium]MDP2665104.1 hypothetical protein [bacterium]